MRHLKIGYSDILNMPTGERRFHLNMLITEKENEKKMYEESNKKNSSSRGTRQTRVSGDALKNQIKSGQVPLV
jgi:hypothetical protein